MLIIKHVGACVRQGSAKIRVYTGHGVHKFKKGNKLLCSTRKVVLTAVFY